MIVEEIGIPTGGAHVASGNWNGAMDTLNHQSEIAHYSHLIDHFSPEQIAASFEVMQPILLEHGYGFEDITGLNQSCVAEVSHKPDLA
jgi:hypothetical protein